MVIATTATLVVPLFWRARPEEAAGRRRWFAFAFATAAAVPLLALGLYAWLGRPDLIGSVPGNPRAGDIATEHASAAMSRGAQSGGDLDAAIERLRTRLAANPGDASGWRLLAQSYRFQGKNDEAAAADLTAESVDRGSAPAPAQAIAPMAPSAPDTPITQLAQQAQEHRRRREFPQAVALFAELERRGALDANLWADYADSLGGARGKLDEDAAACIDAALRLDPDHTKALWLRASLQTQREDFAAALATWQHLARLLPPDSPDARIINANLQEARDKLGAGKPVRSVAAVALRGKIQLDPRLTKRVAAGTPLFVFARAADERGPPLAVWRTAAGRWPLEFKLDDGDAMMPGRKLSDFRRVILEARLSRSGNAQPQPGDLRGSSGVLDPRTAPVQQLTIAEEVGAAREAKGG